MLPRVLHHLERLVSHDTRNPPRRIAPGGLFDELRAALPGFRVEVTDHGAGAVSLLAIRGAPRLLFNVHLDTVPDSPAWTADPLRLRVEEGRAIGLGACDTKGAAAGLLAAAERTTGDAAFLFTTDEEANDPRCIASFLASAARAAFHEVLVAEPTRCEAVAVHRGIASVHLRFEGRAGHASSPDALANNALHHAVRWGSRALDWVETQQDASFAGLRGLRFNVGRIEGGIKANVVAPSAEVRFGFRPLPSQGLDPVHSRMRAFAARGLASYEELFRGPPLPSGDPAQAEARRLQAVAFAERLGLPLGPSVDFWTEASLFSEAGLTALVYGPGDIAQAHTADEWVSLDHLHRYAATAARLLG